MKRTMFRVLFTAFTIVIVLTLISRSLVISAIYDWFAPPDEDVMLQQGLWMADFLEDRWVQESGELVSPGVLMFLDSVQDYRVWLVDSWGRVVYDNHPNELKKWVNLWVPDQYFYHLKENVIVDELQPSPWGQQDLRTVGLSIYHEGQTVGYVILFDTDREWRALKDSFNNVLLVSGLLSLAIGLWVTRWMTHRLLVPIYRIEEFVKRLGRRDFDSSIEDPGIVELSGFVNTLKTISTQLKSSFQSIEKQEKLLRLVLESLEEGVIVVTRQRRIIMVNDTFCQFVGMEAPDAFLPIHEAELPPEILASIQEEITEARIEYRGRIYQLNFARLPWAKRPGELDPYGVYVLRDKTEQEQTDQVRQQFVANVSHELRTPLTGISSLVEALRDGVVPPEQHTKYLDMLYSETRRLGRLTNDLIQITKLGSFDPRVRESFQSVAMGPLVDGILWKLSSRLREKNQSCFAHVDGFYVWGDPDWMEQILLNLLDNAIRFTPNGKTISIKAEAMENGHVIICVKDEGIGIPEESLQRIWDRFYKVDEARTRGSGGSGLGLSIVRQLVERQEGTISVKSEYGFGTEFTLVFPGNGQVILDTSS